MCVCSLLRLDLSTLISQQHTHKRTQTHLRKMKQRNKTQTDKERKLIIENNDSNREVL